MTIFVTGGAGYIGSHTIISLIESGHRVVCADNFINSKPEAVARTKRLCGADFPFYEIDVRDAAALDKVFAAHKDIEAVIHFAGLKAVGESVSKPLAYYANNLDSTIALASAMGRHGVKRVVFSSSATVYSGENEMPLTESSRVGGCTNPYGRTKFMCEQILTDAAKAAGDWSVVLLRYFNPIGAHASGDIGEDPQGVPNNLMPYIAQTAIGRQECLSIWGDDYDTPDGTGVRDYIHVVDLARGHVAAIDYASRFTGADAINLGTGRGTSVLEMVRAFEAASGKPVPYRVAPRRPGDLPVCYASTEKAARVLNWRAEKSIADACADSWRWQSQNPQGF